MTTIKLKRNIYPKALDVVAVESSVDFHLYVYFGHARIWNALCNFIISGFLLCRQVFVMAWHFCLCIYRERGSPCSCCICFSTCYYFFFGIFPLGSKRGIQQMHILKTFNFLSSRWRPIFRYGVRFMTLSFI